MNDTPVTRSAASAAADWDAHRRGAASYYRFEHWLRLQHRLHPGLFSAGIAAARRPPPSLLPPPTTATATATAMTTASTTTVSLQTLRNGALCVRFDGDPVLLCDGCGALVRRAATTRHNTSNSTTATSSCAVCPHCGFCTPLAGLRRALGLGPDSAGLAMPRACAHALVLEALGPERAAHVLSGGGGDDAAQRWVRDVGARRHALDQLLALIGFIHEEDCFVVARTPAPALEHHCAERHACVAAVREGNQFLDAILSFMAPQPSRPQGCLPGAATDSQLHSQLPQDDKERVESRRRLAICCAPVLWSANSGGACHQNDCSSAVKMISESVRVVKEATVLHQSLASAKSSSEETLIRSRLLEISEVLRAARASMRSHRYNHPDTRCEEPASER